MPRTHLRCHTCASRSEVDLGELELKDLRDRGHVIRYCRSCAGNTRWILHEAAGAGRFSAAEERSTSGRVLLIDDDDSILQVLSKVLTKERLAVDTATSGREAVRKLGREDYDLILSDIRMPDFDGKQLFAFLDQHLPDYKARVIFLTGDTANPDTMQFLEETGAPYLTKPIDIPSLMVLIREVLPEE